LKSTGVIDNYIENGAKKEAGFPFLRQALPYHINTHHTRPLATNLTTKISLSITDNASLAGKLYSNWRISGIDKESLDSPSQAELNCTKNRERG